MTSRKISASLLNSTVLSFLLFLTAVLFGSCAQFTYKTYDEKLEETSEDPEPDYNTTLNSGFQNYTNFMFIGNRIENFGTYFNTYFNAVENFDIAYEDYATRLLANYSERLDSIYINMPLSQEAADKFNKSIEKASRVIQFHKGSAYMDDAVLLVGKAYFYLGDYLKAERKFSEFISKLSKSEHLDEAVLFLSRTQLRLNNESALQRLQDLIKNSGSNSIKALGYQTLGEYYIHKKDFESAVANYKKSIALSSDDEFKAQMQYLIASVLSRNDPLTAANEYEKVLDFGTSFDLEYYSKLNYAKNLIFAGKFPGASSMLEQLKVKYKDNAQFQSDIDLLKARYYQQKIEKSGDRQKDYRRALDRYKYVIRTYSKSVSASDAAYFIADYYESVLNDYLNAYRFYRFSNEQNASGHYASKTNSKIKTFKRYFELKSVIIGYEINTDYDRTINDLVMDKTKIEGKEIFKEGEDEGTVKEKGKGQGQRFQVDDSLEIPPVDSFKIKEQQISSSEFELAELFIYELNQSDSAEYYLLESFERSPDYDFKSKVLLALANLYRDRGRTDKAEDVLRTIVSDFPLSPVANASRKLLGIPVVDEVTADIAENLYTDSENDFASGRYNTALTGFIGIVNNYSTSQHFNRSVYAAGWIYENVLSLPDSAVVYYEKLLAVDPKSEYALAVADKVSEYKKNNTPNDSLNNKLIPEEKIRENQEILDPEGKNQKEKLDTDPDKLKKEEDPDPSEGKK